MSSRCDFGQSMDYSTQFSFCIYLRSWDKIFGGLRDNFKFYFPALTTYRIIPYCTAPFMCVYFVNSTIPLYFCNFLIMTRLLGCSQYLVPLHVCYIIYYLLSSIDLWCLLSASCFDTHTMLLHRFLMQCLINPSAVIPSSFEAFC